MPIRVLVVEDNPGDADLVRVALADADSAAFEVAEASTLAAAIARVATDPAPHVVLLDLSLPDATGLDGLRKITATAPEVPVVVLTGGDRAMGTAAIQAGAQDYLSKGGEGTAALMPRALRYAIERHEHAARSRALATERAARAAAESSRERMSLLALASTVLTSSLDDRHALAALAQALVGSFTEWCAIRTVTADVEGREWIAVHSDSGRSLALRRRLEAVPADPRDPYGLAALTASGRAELVDDVADQSGASPWARALAESGARSAILAPIVLNRECLGLITLAARESLPFGPDDLTVAGEIARRAASAIANCRLYREARLAVAARDEFLGVAAHELRTPLSVLQLKLQHVAMRQDPACRTCDRAVPVDYAGATRQVSRLGQLVESLLDVSTIVGRGARLALEEVDLREVAGEVIDRLAELARRSRSEIHLDCAEPARGIWERLSIERIVVNLVSNALKFGAEKPVFVRIRNEGPRVVLEIRDHGIGIADEDRERIFDRFERAVSARHFGGLGLGLYITHRLVQQHGGEISVESAPGAGAVFTVQLPRTRPDVMAPGEHA